MKEREHWKNRSVFIMAAIGSAIGLGNLWRFPYIAAQNGGGAFLIPYFIALLTAGIPIMIIEYGLGIRSQASANIALGSIYRPFRFVGWLAILAAFAINIYYCVVMGWTWCYLFDCFAHKGIAEWAGSLSSSDSHFFADTLKFNPNPWHFGGIRWQILAGLILTWLTIWLIIKSGLGKIGKVLLFTVPVPVILVLILVVNGLTLDNASTGLNYYLSPDWSKLVEPQVWLAAYGQVFFSLSVGFGTMIAYSSFMPKNTEIPNSAAITSFSNCAFSFLAGFAVFSVLGYFAVATNTPITEVAKKGPSLAFVAYPAALAQLPIWVKGFSFLFFLTLLLLGVDSAFSLLETVSAALTDKFDLSRPASTTIVAVISCVLGIPIVTQSGLAWLDIMDHFLMSYVITIVAILECLAVAYFLGTKKFLAEINRNAEIRIGPIFTALVGFVTPVVLGITVVLSFQKEVSEPYGGYPLSAVLVIGVGMIILLVITSIVLSTIHTHTDTEREESAKKLETV